ncbi:hypothetical protein V6251_11270 [Olleya sp. Ti.3.14]|uniref:hypothetical protein n=1 Tax=Olleya sp. Ti.3.14 TaxID=3121297 RepID=UPI00311ED306
METELKSIFEELITTYHNLKAEIIVTEINKNKKDKVDFLIENKSSFSRPYRRDILKVNKSEDAEHFILDLSRNGIYDSLPESFFHIEKLSDRNKSFSFKRQQYKEEEKNARLFFSPIENEFFNQRLNIEENERRILDEFYNLEDEFLIKFWNINQDIPKEYQLKLIKLLPYSAVISGDLELTKRSLEKIIKQKVTFKIAYKSQSLETQSETNKLGVNLVTQSKKSDVLQPFLEVTIGPLKDSDTDVFVNNDGVNQFLNSFYSYFIPLELDVVTKIITNNDKGFVLSKKQTSIMGYSTSI